MELLENWREIAAKAWSVRLIALAGAIDIAAQITPAIGDLIPWWLTVGILLAAMIARLVKQDGLSK